MDKLLLIPFGKEAEIFTRASALWLSRDAKSLNGWKLILYTFGELGQENLAVFENRILYIRQDDDIARNLIVDNSKFAITGQWSILEKLHFIYRRIVLSRIILSMYTGPLLAFFATTTSVINTSGLNAVSELVPENLFVGGQFYSSSDEKGPFTFPSGSGFLTNRFGLSRFAQQSNASAEFDDVWSGRVLEGAVRLRWPRFDLIHPEACLLESLIDYKNRLQRVIQSGVWHVRIKIGDNRVLSNRISIESQLELLSYCHAKASCCDVSPIITRDLVEFI